MKIVINIEADSVQEAKEACQKLGAPITGVYTITGTEAKLEIEELTKQGHFGDAPPDKAEPKPRTRATTKAETTTPATENKEPVTVESLSPLTATTTADPLADKPAAAAVTADPLASTPAPAQTTDPLASAPITKDAAITLQTVRDKIGTMTDKRAAVMDLVKQYKKADGQPAEKPGELQEKDYADVLVALNLLG